MAWFKKERKPRPSVRTRLEIPADTWEKCEQCGHLALRDKFEKNLNVCPECGHHRRMTAEEYIELLTDEGTWGELWGDLKSADPLESLLDGVLSSVLAFSEGERFDDDVCLLGIEVTRPA